ncbi:hypothetical protein [Streptomyces sp. NPDC088847]
MEADLVGGQIGGAQNDLRAALTADPRRTGHAGPSPGDDGST